MATLSGRRPAAALVVLLGLALAGTAAWASAERARSVLPQSFAHVGTGPDGGTIWIGRIRDPAIPELRRSTLVYLPPHVTAGARYPVVYLLHGFRGSPWQYASGLRLATIADHAIESGRARPFIAVAPPAGLTRAYYGEWAGAWESYLVGDVVPWADSHLPTIPSGSQRTLAGLSAGAFGALDIGLRHPRLFGTLESWSGYFTSPRDGPLRGASTQALADHDPSLLARAEARLLRTLGTRFYLSAGTTTDRVTAAHTAAFAHELSTLGVPHSVYLARGGHNQRFWRSQFGRALDYALSPAATERPFAAAVSRGPCASRCSAGSASRHQASAAPPSPRGSMPPGRS